MSVGVENLTLYKESALSARYRRSDYIVALDCKIKLTHPSSLFFDRSPVSSSIL